MTYLKYFLQFCHLERLWQYVDTGRLHAPHLSLYKTDFLSCQWKWTLKSSDNRVSSSKQNNTSFHTLLLFHTHCPHLTSSSVEIIQKVSHSNMLPGWGLDGVRRGSDPLACSLRMTGSDHLAVLKVVDSSVEQHAWVKNSGYYCVSRGDKKQRSMSPRAAWNRQWSKEASRNCKGNLTMSTSLTVWDVRLKRWLH